MVIQRYGEGQAVAGHDAGRVVGPVLGDADHVQPSGGERALQPLDQGERQIAGGAIVLEEDQQRRDGRFIAEDDGGAGGGGQRKRRRHRAGTRQVGHGAALSQLPTASANRVHVGRALAARGRSPAAFDRR